MSNCLTGPTNFNSTAILLFTCWLVCLCPKQSFTKVPVIWWSFRPAQWQFLWSESFFGGPNIVSNQYPWLISQCINKFSSFRQSDSQTKYILSNDLIRRQNIFYPMGIIDIFLTWGKKETSFNARSTVQKSVSDIWTGKGLISVSPCKILTWWPAGPILLLNSLQTLWKG